MESLATHIYETVVQKLAELPENIAADAYAVGLPIAGIDDPRSSYLALFVNTEEQVARSKDRAASPGEARWNSAHWLQEPMWLILESEEDPVGARLRREWVEQLGLWFTDEEEDEADWEWLDERAGGIDSAFRELVTGVIQRLHADGVLVPIFGRAIPVIMNEHDAGDELAVRNEDANPSDLVREFAAWVRGRGSSAS